MTAAKGANAMRRWINFVMVSTVLCLSAASTVHSSEQGAAAPGESEEIRVTRNLRNPERIREQYSKLEKSSDQHKALALSGKRSSPSGQKSTSNDFWFYTADVILFNDDDGDGFYWGIDLLFDADTIYDVADVYAVAYLSYEGGPWNEYAVTDTFSIFGASSDDEYVLVTDLVSGYPTGYYDILIELFDAYDGTFLASYGPEDTSELSLLTLEDSNRDAPFFDDPVAVSTGGGGSTDWWMLAAMVLLLLGTALPNNRKRRRRAASRESKLDGTDVVDARSDRAI